jgi:hypothetical protein
MTTKKQTSLFTAALTPGTVFTTPFESGCVVTQAPDEFGSFLALDSEGVECSYGVMMVISVEDAR